jgi:para-nitrobenzyl esterase
MRALRVVGAAAVVMACTVTAACAGGIHQLDETRLSTKVVTTDSGPVTGMAKSGIEEYLGIPFAAPPVGKLRWQPPQPVTIRREILKATAYQNTCPQPQRGVFASPSTTEDCLYLNVFAPVKTTKALLPVMVWLYGGGLFSGESNDYDGSKLARDGGVIVVTPNFRVGVLGFFSHPAIDTEGHAYANYGIMDQQFALKWVKSNIAHFGGDPNNVTIFGQSGGAVSVQANLESPTAAGLFQRAIVESGLRITTYKPEVARDNALDFAKAVGCSNQTAQCLRALSVEEILKQQNTLVSFVTTNFPMVDGKVIVETAHNAFPAGHFNRVPVINGIVEDEQAFFLPEIASGSPMTPSGYDTFLATTFGRGNVTTLKTKYPLDHYASPSLAAIAVAGDYKACTARYFDQTLSRYVPVFAYQFNDRTAPSYFHPMSYPMGAYHTAELQYLFPLFHGGQGAVHPLNQNQEKLSDQMVDYWTHFARTGAPGSAVDAPLWTKYSQLDNVQYLDQPGITVTSAYGNKHDCSLWQPMLPIE